MTAPTQETGRLSTADLAALLILVQAQAQVRQQLTQVAVAAAIAPLRAYTGWWDAAKTARLIAQILRVVQPAQRQAARVSDAYMARVLTRMLGRPVSPVGAIDVTNLRRKMHQALVEELAAGRIVPQVVDLGDSHDGPGADIDLQWFRTVGDEEFADPADPYGRVADGFRYDVVARGLPADAARARAINRISAVAATDITLAVREQVRSALVRRQDVLGYRRILHPELTRTGPCGLCVVAADRTYRKEELLALHDRCVCEVLPVIRGVGDPGLHLNRSELDQLYQAAGGTAAAGLKKIRVALAEHGELGPVLIDAAQHFRGPADVARTRSASRTVRAAAQLETLERDVAALLARADRGENVIEPLRWQQNRIDRLRRAA